METKLGLVGLPNAGKSTLFNALTRGTSDVAPYPFTTTSPHVGVAPIDDQRLEALGRLIAHGRLIPTTLEVVDIAGLVKGAHRGEGLGNQFLSHIFAVDALLHVVRCFHDPNVAHVMSEVDPVRDVEVIETELLLKDLEILNRRLQKEQKLAKGGDKQAKLLIERLEQWKQSLEQGRALRHLGLAPPDQPRAFGIDLLSAKPILYVANVDETALEAPSSEVGPLQERARQDRAELLILCAKLEAELAELEPSDRVEMMRELHLSESALPLVVRQGYTRLGLITFFTTASKIIQAWTVARGTKAPQAAGVIHTDFERQFICAEVISVDTLIGCGGEAQAKTSGLLRLEGKAYVVQEGDVIRFHVGQ